LGRSSDGNWLKVEVVSTKMVGWVGAASRFVVCVQDIARLPVAAAPPLAVPIKPAEPERSDTPPAADGIVEFTASATTLNAGGCTQLSWHIEHVSAAHLNGGEFRNRGVTGPYGAQQVCPSQTTTYSLIAQTDTGTIQRNLMIEVRSPAPIGSIVRFHAEQATINQGGCTRLIWHIENVNAAYLSGGAIGVTGITGPDGQRQDCPDRSTIYVLEVHTASGVQRYEAPVTVIVPAPIEINPIEISAGGPLDDPSLFNALLQAIPWFEMRHQALSGSTLPVRVWMPGGGAVDVETIPYLREPYLTMAAAGVADFSSGFEVWVSSGEELDTALADWLVEKLSALYIEARRKVGACPIGPGPRAIVCIY
jgi:hypothetical protein